MSSPTSVDGGAGAAGVPSPSWPVRSGTVPAIADGYIDRLETAPDLAAVLHPGAMVALVSHRAADPGRTAGSTARDWLRSSGKTQIAVALAESLWHSGELDLLVWIDASSRASVLSGYAAATALVTGRGQQTSCESTAAQFLSWLAETSHPWLIVLDDLTDEANLDGLRPAGPAGRTLVTCADAAAVPRGVRVMPIGPFNSREALSYLTERLSANRGQRLGAIDLVHAMGVEPAALAQASAVIASSAMSCHSYQDYFVRWREYLASSAGALPLAGGFLAGPDAIAKEKLYPLEIHCCASCGLVQLLNPVDPEILFQDYSFSSSTIKPLVDHLATYAGWLSTHLQPKSVVEFGCNDGVLLRPLADQGIRNVIGVDPASNVISTIDDSRIEAINDYFTEEVAARIVAEYGAVDLILANNVYAHIRDIQGTTRAVARALHSASRYAPRTACSACASSSCSSCSISFKSLRVASAAVFQASMPLSTDCFSASAPALTWVASSAGKSS